MTHDHARTRGIAPLLLLAALAGGCANLPFNRDPAPGIEAASAPETAPAIDPETVSSEGMWRPDQLPALAPQMKALGLELDPETLADLSAYPLNAVISLDGCTASFVSPDGLAVTNHHCAYGAIQYNSTADNNLIEKGFLAAARAEELPAAPGARIYVTTSVTDVTARIMRDVAAGMDGLARFDAVEQAGKDVIAECEEDRGYRCAVDAFFGGREYRLTKRLEIRDVRLVYAPPESIGKFGGDVDNWMWPRHTGDFSFYRAYVGPDGEPADPSPDNRPYAPASHLALYAEPLKAGDFVMVAGYPGSTNRYRRLSEVDRAFSWDYPTRRALYQTWADAIEAAAPEGTDARVKYASLLAALHNAVKNFDGQMAGAERVGLVERRRERESALDAWISAEPARQAAWADSIDDLDSLVARSADLETRQLYYGLATRTAPLRAARKLLRLAHEREKPDAMRESGYQDRDLPFLRDELAAMERRYDRDVDIAVWTRLLRAYLDQPDNARVKALDDALGVTPATTDRRLKQVATRLLSQTKLEDSVARLGQMDATVAELEASADPVMKLAVALYDADIAMEIEEKTLEGEAQPLRAAYMDAILAWKSDQGLPAYPDANSTLRVTFGTVRGDVSPKDGLVYAPFTTLEGIVEKQTGEPPFNAPDAQLEAIRSQDHGGFALDSLGSVPVDFLSTLDVTGGNSGSPTLNARGELVGLLFDGTYESVNSDWDFDERTTRSIHVDARYMLWVMQKISGAGLLLDELGVSAAPHPTAPVSGAMNEPAPETASE